MTPIPPGYVEMELFGVKVVVLKESICEVVRRRQREVFGVKVVALEDEPSVEFFSFEPYDPLAPDVDYVKIGFRTPDPDGKVIYNVNGVDLPN